MYTWCVAIKCSYYFCPIWAAEGPSVGSWVLPIWPCLWWCPCFLVEPMSQLILHISSLVLALAIFPSSPRSFSRKFGFTFLNIWGQDFFSPSLVLLSFKGKRSISFSYSRNLCLWEVWPIPYCLIELHLWNHISRILIEGKGQQEAANSGLTRVRRFSQERLRVRAL